jgi:hypothetical protein
LSMRDGLSNFLMQEVTWNFEVISPEVVSVHFSLLLVATLQTEHNNRESLFIIQC